MRSRKATDLIAAVSVPPASRALPESPWRCFIYHSVDRRAHTQASTPDPELPESAVLSGAVLFMSKGLVAPAQTWFGQNKSFRGQKKKKLLLALACERLETVIYKQTFCTLFPPTLPPRNESLFSGIESQHTHF